MGILTCQQYIFKTIWARDLKFAQLIEDGEQITWLNEKKNHLIFPELWSFEMFGVLNLSAICLGNYVS